MCILFSIDRLRMVAYSWHSCFLYVCFNFFFFFFLALFLRRFSDSVTIMQLSLYLEDFYLVNWSKKWIPPFPASLPRLR